MTDNTVPAQNYLYTIPGLQGLLTTAGQTVTDLLTQYDENYVNFIKQSQNNNQTPTPEPTSHIHHLELDQQYIDCSSIIQFFFWFFSLLVIIAAVIKWKVLDVSVAEQNLDHPEIELLGENSSKATGSQPHIASDQNILQKNSKPDSDNNVAGQVAGDKNPKNEDEQQQQEQEEQVIQKNDPKDVSVRQDDIEKEDDIQIEMKDGNNNNGNGNDNDQDAENQNDEQGKNKAQNNNEEQNEEDKKKQKPLNNAENDDSAQKKIFIMKTIVKVVEDFTEKYFVIWAIFTFLIINFGSYGYSAFVLFVCVILQIGINSLDLDKKIPQIQGFGHLFYHFMIITLYIAYFIINQQFYTNASDEDILWQPITAAN